MVLVGVVPHTGEHGVITNSPGKLFNGCAVKLDNGHVVGVGRRHFQGCAAEAARAIETVGNGAADRNP